jgi:hypothetical protein
MRSQVEPGNEIPSSFFFFLLSFFSISLGVNYGNLPSCWSGAEWNGDSLRLDETKHHVTVFEKQPILGGHIRTLESKNVVPNQSRCNEILENGVLDFPTVFYNFKSLSWKNWELN